MSFKNSKNDKIPFYKESQMLLSDQFIRKKIFNIEVFENSEEIKLFEKLDSVIFGIILILKKETKFVEHFFIECYNEIVSGKARFKTFFDKDTKNKKYVKSSSGYSVNDHNFLTSSYSILHSFYRDIDLSAIKFNRVVYENLVLNFLDLTSEYLDTSKKVLEGKYSSMDDIHDIEDTVKSSGDLYGVVKLIRDMWKDYQEIRNSIVLPYLRYAYSLASNNSISSSQTTENFQSGVVALLKAVSYYNPSRSSFGTYAKLWIRQYIINSIRNSSIITVPHGIWQNYNILEKARTPDTTISDLSKKTGFSSHRIKNTYTSVLVSQTSDIHPMLENEDNHFSDLSYEVSENDYDFIFSDPSFLTKSQRLIMACLYEKFDIVTNTLTKEDKEKEIQRQVETVN